MLTQPLLPHHHHQKSCTKGRGNQPLLYRMKTYIHHHTPPQPHNQHLYQPFHSHHFHHTHHNSDPIDHHQPLHHWLFSILLSLIYSRGICNPSIILNIHLKDLSHLSQIFLFP